MYTNVCNHNALNIYMYVRVLVHVNVWVRVCTYIKYSVPRLKKKAPAPCIVAGLAHCQIGGKIQRSPGRG